MHSVILKKGDSQAQLISPDDLQVSQRTLYLPVSYLLRANLDSVTKIVLHLIMV